jgi:succinyl-diaminopimelate desuccinylase
MAAAHHVPADSPFIQTLLTCYETYSGKKGYCEAIGGGTYVHEIPGGVAFGAGNSDFASNLHAANERASIRNMLMAAKIYAQAIVELCGADAE